MFEYLKSVSNACNSSKTLLGDAAKKTIILISLAAAGKAQGKSL